MDDENTGQYVQEVCFDQLANQHFYTIQVFSENRPSFYIAEIFFQNHNNKTMLGFNQTHLCNLLTDSKCRIIPQQVELLKTLIPENRREVMRWPGGTVSMEYTIGQLGHNAAETKSGKWKRYGVDPLEVFLYVSKLMGWKILVVINGYTLFKNFADKYTYEAESILQLNLIQKIKDAGLPIAGVEIGNELQIYCSVRGQYINNKEAFNRDIDKYFTVTEEMNEAIRWNFPDLYTGACFVTPKAALANGRDGRWWQVFKNTKCDALIVHHYEDDPNKIVWQRNLSNMVNEISGKLNKQCWLTESNWNFGLNNTNAAYASAIKSPELYKAYQSAWADMVNTAGFDIACYHRIAGDKKENHPYNFIQM